MSETMGRMLNSFDLNAAEITRGLSQVGRGDMLDGVKEFFFEGLSAGESIGYKNRLIEEALEASSSDTLQKIAFAGGGVALGIGLGAGINWLTKKHRAKKERKLLESQASSDTEPTAA